MHRPLLGHSLMSLASIMAALTYAASIAPPDEARYSPIQPKQRFNKTSGRQHASKFDGKRGRRGARRKWIGGQKLLWRH